jgi:hypothetical protein
MVIGRVRHQKFANLPYEDYGVGRASLLTAEKPTGDGECRYLVVVDVELNSRYLNTGFFFFRLFASVKPRANRLPSRRSFTTFQHVPSCT